MFTNQVYSQPLAEIIPSMITKYPTISFLPENSLPARRLFQQPNDGRGVFDSYLSHEDRKLHPENRPHGSRFIDYQDFVVQDIIFTNWNIRYKIYDHGKIIWN